MFLRGNTNGKRESGKGMQLTVQIFLSGKSSDSCDASELSICCYDTSIHDIMIRRRGVSRYVLAGVTHHGCRRGFAPGVSQSGRSLRFHIVETQGVCIWPSGMAVRLRRCATATLTGCIPSTPLPHPSADWITAEECSCRTTPSTPYCSRLCIIKDMMCCYRRRETEGAARRLPPPLRLRSRVRPNMVLESFFDHLPVLGGDFVQEADGEGSWELIFSLQPGAQGE